MSVEPGCGWKDVVGLGDGGAGGEGGQIAGFLVSVPAAFRRWVGETRC
jgi:hypothetical protein